VSFKADYTITSIYSHLGLAGIKSLTQKINQRIESSGKSNSAEPEMYLGKKQAIVKPDDFVKCSGMSQLYRIAEHESH
jgi:hypothetical protein